MRLNQALIRPGHRGPTFNDIFPKLMHAKNFMLIDTNLGYHNLKFGEKPSYIMAFSYHCGRYRCKRLLFGEDLAGDMFQRKIDKFFRELPNIFVITDGIVILSMTVIAQTMAEYYE